MHELRTKIANMKIGARASLLLLSLLTVLGLTAGMNPSLASAAYSDCVTWGRVCTYRGPGGGGTGYWYTGPTNGSCINIGAPYKNDISSAWNRFTSYNVTFGTADCSNGGGHINAVLAPNEAVTFGGLYDNNFEAVYINRP